MGLTLNQWLGLLSQALVGSNPTASAIIGLDKHESLSSKKSETLGTEQIPSLPSSSPTTVKLGGVVVQGPVRCSFYSDS